MLRLVNNEINVNSDQKNSNDDNGKFYPYLDKEIKEVLYCMNPISVLQTTGGYKVRFASTNKVPDLFWEMWVNHKDYVKSIGFRVTKTDSDQWLLLFEGTHFDKKYCKKIIDETLKSHGIAKQDKYDSFMEQTKKGSPS